MKTLFTLVLFLSAIANAKLNCFKADQYVYGLPQMICLEAVKIEKDGLRMTGKNINLSTQDFAMEDPDLHTMSATFKFIEIYETCGTSLNSKLETNFRIGGSGEVDYFPSMSIQVSYEETSDSCHSSWSRGVVNYKYSE